MDKGLYTCCIRTPERVGRNCDTRSFSNFDALQHPNRAFPDRGFFLNNDQFAVLYNILSVVVFLGTYCKTRAANAEVVRSARTSENPKKQFLHFSIL